MRIFLTHIDEEAGLAAVLKRWIQGTFPDSCDVFVSSDTNNIRLGDKWLDEVDQALDDAELFLVLCSPQSVRRPWVNFETGCGWIKRVRIIPICHSGQAKGELPLPLSAFQGIEISQSDFAEELLKAIAEKASNGKVPPIDFVQMMKEIRNAEQADVATNDPTEPPATAGLEPVTQEIELALLESLVGHVNTVDGIADHLNTNPVLVKFHLDELVAKKMVYARYSTRRGIPDSYVIAHEGRRTLIEHGLIK